jgi:hypothetical protein
MSSSGFLGLNRPGFGRDSLLGLGDCFVVEGAAFEAAVEDADEPVGQLAREGVVFGAAGSEPVVVGARAGVR